MAKTLKTKGLEELNAFKLRTNREYAMRRIKKRDHDEIVTLVNKLEAKVTIMWELNENGEEEFDG